ncbi:MAG: hypothetical protein AAB116_13230 [Candidatus Poribacteria bacterium]
MASIKQIEANRRNARKSTGPQTKEGQAISSMNSARHGILSSKALLPSEAEVEYATFINGIYTSLDPSGELERLLVDRIATTAWRLGRVNQVESLLFDFDNVVSLREPNISYPIRQGCGSFALLSRYETSLERSFYRALHEFQRVKAMRLGQQVSIPTAVDVDISISSDPVLDKCNV